jgi:hypothetical protein
MLKSQLKNLGYAGRSTDTKNARNALTPHIAKYAIRKLVARKNVHVVMMKHEVWSENSNAENIPLSRG